VFEHAVSANKTAIVKTLLDNGAVPDILLHRAMAYRKFEIAKMLVKAGVSVNSRDSNGNTPFHAAMESAIADHTVSKYFITNSNYSLLFRFLLENGADINAVNKKGETPLDLAIAAKIDSLSNYMKSKGAKTGNEMR
jgi:ankyrin repeat protein